MDERYLVTGATGLIGSGVLNALRALGKNVLGASRSAPGNGWVNLDFENPRTFPGALAGMDKLMLIARPGDENADVLAAPLIEEMVRQGISKVCLLSALGAGQRPEFSLRKVEKLVEQSGLSWVHVRPNFFMQMLAIPPLSVEIRERKTLSLPLGSARVAYVHARDVVDVMVKALCDDTLNGAALELNGPHALTHEDIAASISEAAGQRIRYVDITDAHARQLLQERNFAPAHVERVMTFYKLIKAGWCAQADCEIASLLGRPLRTFGDFAFENRERWN